MNTTTEDAVKIALLRKTLEDLIEEWGGQVVDPKCDCGDCNRLRPLYRALEQTQ
jgi:hypothetical protein